MIASEGTGTLLDLGTKQAEAVQPAYPEEVHSFRKADFSTEEPHLPSWLVGFFSSYHGQLPVDEHEFRYRLVHGMSWTKPLIGI